MEGFLVTRDYKIPKARNLMDKTFSNEEIE